jgi:RND family efflux transporter MFP subunit
MEAAKPDLAALRIDRGKRRRNGGRAWLWVVAAVALVAAVAVVLVTARDRAVAVEVASAQPVAAGGSVAVLSASGYVTPRRWATVAAKITGQVTEVLVEEGMEVTAGQVLARLDDVDASARRDATRAERDVARANLAEIQVNLSDAERDLRRVQRLHADQVASDDDLDAARTAVDALAARLELARQQLAAADAQLAVADQDLENYTIRAPFAGIAVSKDAQPGEMVSPVSAGGGFTRTGISTIVDMASLEIEVDVNESYIARVAPGQPVEAVLDAYPDWRIPASVRTVIPTADRQKATVKVRIAFAELDPRILPDMGVKVTFLEEHVENDADAPVARALVPQRAVRMDGDRQVVFVVAGGTAARRAVTLGRERGSDVEVLAGVAAGEQVVVSGPEELVDGQRVVVPQ